tara:strand:+ start:431 stop:544 length:114 start_codon:yes stop_codon:yes gene_type:complete
VIVAVKEFADDEYGDFLISELAVNPNKLMFEPELSFT